MSKQVYKSLSCHRQALDDYRCCCCHVLRRGTVDDDDDDDDVMRLDCDPYDRRGYLWMMHDDIMERSEKMLRTVKNIDQDNSITMTSQRCYCMCISVIP
jgi:hypothetical protein